MIENITIRKQIATQGHMLYQLQDDGYYNITDCVYLGINSAEWAECTLAEAEEYMKHNAELDATQALEEPTDAH